MHFMNKHHKVSFSYYFIFDRIICVLVTFWERGHFVMLMIKSLHLINLHFWTYLLSSAANLRYLRANTKRPFRWLLLRSGSSFRLKGFHPFLDIYTKCCCRSRQTFVLQLFDDFSCRISSFIHCFFYNFLFKMSTNF